MSEKCKAAMRIAARLIALGTAAVSVYAMLEVHALLETNSSIDESGKLSMPVLVCMPQQQQQAPDVTGAMEGNVTTNNSTDSSSSNSTMTTEGVDTANVNVLPEFGNCKEIEYLAYASITALALAALAVLIFLLVDIWTHMGRSSGSPLNQSASMGMALFSTFILFQAAVSTGAVLEQVREWQDYYDNLLAKDDESPWVVQEQDNNVIVTEISIKGNQTILLTAIIALLVTTLLMFSEVVASMCCCGGGGNKNNNAAPAPEMSAPFGQVNKSYSGGDDNDYDNNNKMGESAPPVDTMATAESHPFDSPSTMNSVNDASPSNEARPSWSTYA